MQQEQIIKRLEWLDEERRKDKTTIATLEERLVALEGNVPALTQQVKDLTGEVTRLSTFLARFDQIDAALAQMRVENSRAIDAIEKARGEHEREVDKAHRIEMEGINKSLAEVRKGLEPIPELKKSIQSRTDEEYRLGRLIEEVDAKVVEITRFDEEYKRSQRLLEEGRRQDAKRLTDLQGEVSAMRKRLDEQRGKVDLNSDNLRKLETRLTEMLAAESERRQSQTAFIEKQTLGNVERERTWKDWQARFEAIERQSTGLDAQLQTLDTLNRSVKRSQESLDEVTQRIERRINEITEMQRLTEDRFRQEWTTFRADDQKRWMNYTLAQEEQGREVGRQFDKFTERVVTLEDLTQEIQDVIHQVNEENGKRLQSLMALTHEWMTAYERAFGSSHR